MNLPSLETFHNYESEARSYCRRFPVIFTKAKGSFVYDDLGERYLDFICGAGALNYGHNNDLIKKAVLDYINDDLILMSLDMHTRVKGEFIESFQEYILDKRNLSYKLQFTSPTGTSVVESAVKLARKCTGRQNIVAFTNAFHGMTGNSLSFTGNKYHRQLVSFGSVTRLPYDGYLGTQVDSVAFYRKLFEDHSSGVDLPAAVILETIQCEGGLNVASNKWLQDLRALTEEYGVLLIVDDIQAGCGRSGKFFSFERADIKPDLVCLSKSIGGMGFPMALLLIDPKLDIWSPGEDNGTFRGNNLAFVASRVMIEHHWKNDSFEKDISNKTKVIRAFVEKIAEKYDNYINGIRGLGFMQGIEFYSERDTSDIISRCFENKLILEACGPRDQVLKLMPALTIELDVLQDGLDIIEQSIDTHFREKTRQKEKLVLESVI